MKRLFCILTLPLLCGIAYAQPGKPTVDVLVTNDENSPVSVEVVGDATGQTGECSQYKEGRYFQLYNTFQAESVSYDTLVSADDPEDSFVIKRVVLNAFGLLGADAVSRMGFNALNNVNPGITINPTPIGNLGIDFAPAYQNIVGNLNLNAVFEPNTVHRISVSLRVAVFGDNPMSQAAISIHGCLFRAE